MSNEITIDFGTLNLDDTNNITISSIKVKEKKSVRTINIPKSDGAIAELAKRQALIITVKGDIAGTGYDDLRTNLDTLKAGLQNGSQKFTMDDDRYVMGQLRDFDFSYVHPTIMATWSATFVSHYPFWLSETLYEDDRTPIDSYVQLLILCKNATGSTTFTDELGKTITTVGDAQVDDGWILLDGTGDNLTLADFAGWYFGTAAFTINAKGKFTSTTGAQTIVGQYVDGTHYWSVGKNASHQLFMIFVNGTTQGYYYTDAISFETGVEYHFEFSRNTGGGVNGEIYLDGVNQSLTVDTAFSTNDVGDLGGLLYIGQYGGGDYFNGRLRSVMISKGIARHISTGFTPPTLDYGSFVLTNGGNAPTRCKIEITAPAATMPDDCKIDNDTRGESFSYRGTVAAAKVLEVDNRVDTDDFEVLNDGSDDHVNFEGDFPVLSAGNNDIETDMPPLTAIKTSYHYAWY